MRWVFAAGALVIGAVVAWALWPIEPVERHEAQAPAQPDPPRKITGKPKPPLEAPRLQQVADPSGPTPEKPLEAPPVKQPIEQLGGTPEDPVRADSPEGRRIVANQPMRPLPDMPSKYGQAALTARLTRAVSGVPGATMHTVDCLEHPCLLVAGVADEAGAKALVDSAEWGDLEGERVIVVDLEGSRVAIGFFAPEDGEDRLARGRERFPNRLNAIPRGDAVLSD